MSGGGWGAWGGVGAAWVADKSWEAVDLKVTLEAMRLGMITEKLNLEE